MQVASVLTDKPTLRSEIGGWTYEDSSLLNQSLYRGKAFIGYTPCPRNIPQYNCVLAMLADGWELLGPPQQEGDCVDEHNQPVMQWGWWLHRKVGAS